MKIAFFICICIFCIGSFITGCNENNHTLRTVGVSLEWFAIGGETMYIVWMLINMR